MYQLRQCAAGAIVVTTVHLRPTAQRASTTLFRSGEGSAQQFFVYQWSPLADHHIPDVDTMLKTSTFDFA
jgi:hypothetical protein